MSLKQKTLAAGRWTTTSALLRSALQLLQTMILARLLVPADFGLMAVVGAVLAIVGLFADLGFTRALIHYPTPPPSTLSSLYWLNVAMGVFLMLLLVACTPAVSALYQEPALVRILPATSLVFPLSALGQQFKTLAEKELRFGALARNEVLSALVGFTIAVAVAWVGGGVYALVAGILGTTTSSSLLAWWRLSDGYRPSWHARPSETWPYLRFGGYLVGEGFANTVRMQADVFIAGLLFGPSAIGMYALPRDLSLRIASTVFNPVVTRIGFPVMARLQHDRTALRSIYLQTLRMTASVNFPVYIALGVFADGAVALLLGPQWHEAGLYLRIFAAWGLIRSVGNPVGNLLHAAGRVRLALWWNIVLLFLLPPLFWLGAKTFGLQGLAWSMLATQALMFLPAWRLLVYPLCGARFPEYMAQIAPAFAAALTAGALALAASGLVDATFARLLLGIATGGVTYLGLSLWLNRPWIASVFEVLGLRPFGKRREASASASRPRAR